MIIHIYLDIRSNKVQFFKLKFRKKHFMIGNQEDSYELLTTLIGGVCNEIETLTVKFVSSLE